MNWSLLLFVVFALIVVALIDLVKGGTAAVVKNKYWYALSLFTCGLLAYFIKEDIVQKLILIGCAIGFVHIFKGLNKVKGDTNIYNQ
ncbi:hypothetical protein PDL71_15380 [Lacibacter sp. MH-610]|uniref:hypothetical protein n=1 Tax=Lacibacter sp. MH-610 TaxID=3020883 RepID=UPI003891D678